MSAAQTLPEGSVYADPPARTRIGAKPGGGFGGVFASSVMLALAVLLRSALLVAIAVTTCAAATVPGGVYSPVEGPLLAMLPTDPAASVHVTDVSAAPLTAAVNCAVCGGVSVLTAAATLTDTTAAAPLCATISMASILAAPATG